jgi:hypothetical protein
MTTKQIAEAVGKTVVTGPTRRWIGRWLDYAFTGRNPGIRCGNFPS